MGIEVDHVLLPAVAIILLISVLPAIIHLARNPAQAKSLWKAANKQVMNMFGWDEEGNKLPKEKPAKDNFKEDL